MARKRNYTSPPPWHGKVGVFKAGVFWIVRIKKPGKMSETISRHDTEEEALIKFNKENEQIQVFFRE